jgi:hypothetical protein
MKLWDRSDRRGGGEELGVLGVRRSVIINAGSKRS